MQVKKLTPVMMVENIEPCLDFWTALGFSKTVELPHGDKLGFVILQKDGIEIMYQTRESVAADVPPLGTSPQKGTFLFIEIDDVDWIDRTLRGHDYVVPRRQTFYGADEIIVREPGGNIVTFAQFKREENQ